MQTFLSLFRLIALVVAVSCLSLYIVNAPTPEFPYLKEIRGVVIVSLICCVPSFGYQLLKFAATKKVKQSLPIPPGVHIDVPLHIPEEILN